MSADKGVGARHMPASVPSAYQTAFSSYTVFRNAQTNTVKGFKDIDMAIIQAAR